MTWKQFGAKVGGAALGWATADVGGAIIGYELGKKLTEEKTMVAAKRRGSRSQVVTVKKVKPDGNRGVSKKTITGSAPTKKGKMTAVSNQSSRAVRHKVLQKNHKGKQKPVVRVPKKLRKQVLKVFDSKMVKGVGRVVICGGRISLNSNPIRQTVFALPIPRAGNRLAGALFTPEFIMYCASRLWNGRLSEGGTLTAGSWDNLLIESQPGTAGSPGKWSNFSDNILTQPSAFKVDVTDLKAKITMKNNSGRTMYLKMYECKPKLFRKDTSGFNGGLGFPFGDWASALQYDGQAVVDGALNANGQSSINISANGISQSVNTSTMYATPKICRTWNRQWNCNVVEIILEPGQTHVHWVQGDVGTYDFSKYYTKAQDGSYEFNNIQKTDRHVFFTGVNEMASVSDTASGRMNGPATDLLLFETEIFCTMAMPETAGLVASLPDINPLNLPLSQRKRGYFVDTYYGVGDNVTTAFNVNRDDNNPILQTA